MLNDFHFTSIHSTKSAITLPAGNTTVQLLTLYIDPERYNLQTDDIMIMMPIADHTA